MQSISYFKEQRSGVVLKREVETLVSHSIKEFHLG